MVVNVGTESPQASAGLDPSQIATAVVLTDLPEVGEQILPDICGSSSANVHPDLNPRTGAGFLHLYGWMGIPMVLIFLLSAAWTIMLAVIQQIPTTYANYLMNTGDLDSGDFWILPRPEEHIVVPAIVLLALFGLGYVSLAVLMFFPDKLMPTLWHGQSCSPEYHKNRRSRWQVFSILSICRKSLRPVTMQSSEGEFESKVRPVKSRRNTMTAPTGFSWARVLYEVTSPHGLIRHYYNPLLDLPKLIFQTTTLATYLHHGFPIIVIFIYSCALYINWLVSSYRYKRVRPDPHFVIVRIFYSLDLFFAVFAPLEVLVYAYFTFQFDRAAFATRVATLNAGSFDRTARLFADPTQVSLFRIAFHYLQFTDAPMLLVKCALNALSIFKWWRVIVHLVEHARVVPPVGASVMLRATESQKLAKVRRRQYFQNLLIAATFFAAGTAVFIHSIVAVTSTMTVCEIHKQCKVMSYQWNVGAKHCSCIVFVDRDTAPKTIVEWENPIDTTANLAALATSGHLEIIQIVNRQLPKLPEQLRKCHHLKEVILIYTKTLSFPDWAKEFTKMEYLHIQGDLTAKQLTYLPQNLFVDMTHLMFLHLGSLVKLPYVPDLSRLKRLEYLGLGMLHSVTEVPSLQNLINLRRVSIIDAIRLYSLPPTHHLRKLKTFALTAREPMCCNGYLTGKCDLTDFSCRNRTASGEPLVTCTTKRVDPLDYEVITSTNGIVCEKNLTFDLKDVKPTLAATDIACGGVLYKQCTLKSVQGMCFPTRMMAISCQINKNYIAMRRLQIQRRVGDKCDPAVEQWLGCTA